MKTDEKTVIIVPGAMDCNRGDQAIIWECARMIRDADPAVGIHLLASTKSPSEYSQSVQQGFSVSPVLLDNPNRTQKGGESTVRYSRCAFLLLAVTALCDWFYSVCLLTFAPWPRIIRLLLSGGKRESYDALRRSTFVAIKGGGFIYANRGLRDYYFLWFSLFHLMLALRMKKKVVVFPNSFGPFETVFSRFFAAAVLKRCNRVFCRESQSLELLRKIGVSHVEPVVDAAFFMERSEEKPEWARQELIRRGVTFDRPLVGVTMRPWRFPGSLNPHGDYEKYLDAFRELVRHLDQHGFRPLFFVHVRGPGENENDRKAIDDCLAGLTDMGVTVLDDETWCCRDLLAFYAHMDAMVCTRFHSFIFAAIDRIPALAVGYQGSKTSGIMGDLGMEEFAFSIADLTAAELIRAWERLRANGPIILQRYESYRNRIESDRAGLVAYLKGLLCDSPPR